MLKEWQFNVLFFVGVGGAIVLLIGPELGLQNTQNPTAVTGVGAILTYVLTQKRLLVKGDEESDEKKPKSKKQENSSGDEGEQDKTLEGSGDGL